jgi:hypothetical protein
LVYLLEIYLYSSRYVSGERDLEHTVNFFTLEKGSSGRTVQLLRLIRPDMDIMIWGHWYISQPLSYSRPKSVGREGGYGNFDNARAKIPAAFA